jgi:hypothetical protein
MHRLTLYATTLILLATPLSLAHDPAGTPKNYCEPETEWNIHDYGGPVSGNAITGSRDGNVAGDCSGATDLNLCASLGPSPPFTASAGFCDGPLADFDGHKDFAYGGAFLHADSGDGVSSGSVACHGAEGHHETYPTVVVEDVVLGDDSLLFFVVTADYSRAGFEPAEGPDCGDNLVEVCNPADPVDQFEQLCNPRDQAIVGLSGHDIANGTRGVSVPFPPGVDGTYNVFVGQGGTLGHIFTTAYGTGRAPGDLPPVCPGHGAYA